MKNNLLVSILCVPFCFATTMANETDDRDAVVNMVQAFFDAMAARDVEGMKSMLTSDGILYGYREDEDGLAISRRAHHEFAAGMAEGDSKLIERFWEPQVLLHDRMAAVWTPYDLYIDGVFSHCGIDNFSFLKTDQGWQIAGIVFSMETNDCADSPLGPLQE